MKNAQVEVWRVSGLNSGCLWWWERGEEGKLIWEARADLGHSNDWLGQASPHDRRQNAACGHGQSNRWKNVKPWNLDRETVTLSPHYLALLLQSDPLLPPPVPCSDAAVERRHWHRGCSRGLLVPLRSGTICDRLRPSAARLKHGRRARNSEQPRLADRFNFNLHHLPVHAPPVVFSRSQAL